MADSNVLMPSDYIARLLEAWRDDTGLVCSPPLGCAPHGLWAEFECAFLNTYQARWQCIAESAGFGFTQGKTMLWRRDFLAAHGGIRALASEIAEDAAATKLVRRAGLRVRLVERPFEQPLGPALRTDENLLYVNCGDWVESCTAAVEHFDGGFEIIEWTSDTVARMPPSGGGDEPEYEMPNGGRFQQSPRLS